MQHKLLSIARVLACLLSAVPAQGMDSYPITRAARKVIAKNERAIAVAGLIAGTVGIIALVNHVCISMEQSRIQAEKDAAEAARLLQRRQEREAMRKQRDEKAGKDNEQADEFLRQLQIENAKKKSELEELKENIRKANAKLADLDSRIATEQILAAQSQTASTALTAPASLHGQVDEAD